MANNEFSIEGRISRAELKFTGSGTAVCNAGLAYSVAKKGDDGKWVEDHVEWFNLVAWRRLAEILGALPTGTLIRVSGRMLARPYQTADGEKRISHEVAVDSISMPIISEKSIRVEGKEVIFTRGSKREAPVNNGIEDELYEDAPSSSFDEDPF